jgi:hypothetical protein
MSREREMQYLEEFINIYQIYIKVNLVYRKFHGNIYYRIAAILIKLN